MKWHNVSFFSSGCPPFRSFRDDSCLQMMNVVAVSNDFQTLTINHLKAHVNDERNTFIKAAKKIVMDHYEEAHKNSLCQFTHDGAILLNKDKCQDFGM